METAFKGIGYKVQTRELSYFHDDYGLKTGEDEDDNDDDDEEEEDEDGSSIDGDQSEEED